MKVNTIHPMVGLVRYESWKSEWAKKDEIDELSYISNKCSPEGDIAIVQAFFS